MLTPAFVGRLRRSGLWSLGQRAHEWIAPPICAAIHAAVTHTSDRFIPKELALKHVYDYSVVFIDPALIEHTMHVGAWRGPANAQRERRRTRFKRWVDLGGGWKNARRHPTRNLHGRFVADGDWDAAVRPLQHRRVIMELFVEGRPPEETGEYQKLRHRIEAGNFAYTHGCLSMEDLEDYFAQLINAFEEISTSGYKTQRELGLDGSDEIRVCIDRLGRLCIFSGGTHRLTMARVLGISRVPVLIKRVHASWVASCMAHFGTEDVTAAIAHGVAEMAGRSNSAHDDAIL